MSKRVERMGRWVKGDEVFEAWSSRSLPRMLAARSVRTNPIDRHHLLQSIVKETYRQREKVKMRQLCIETGLMHLQELPKIIPALKTDFNDVLPRVSSVAWLATALAEAGREEEAVKACLRAAELGLEDGTKGGYAGRAKRIEKKRLKKPPPSPAQASGSPNGSGCTSALVLAALLLSCFLLK